MIHRIFVALAAAFCAAGAGAADLDAGKSKSLVCQACHGAAGVGTAPDIPNLAGQKERYLAAQLTAFRAKERKNDLMNAIAGQLGDADIANLAAFWSSLPANGTAAADPAAEFRKSHMQFPTGFPKGFVMYIDEVDAEAKTARRSYVNTVALKAAKAKQPLPPGSAIIVENWSTKSGADGKLVPDQVVGYAAMETRAGWGDGIPEILRNGDWNYALFDAQKQQRDFNYARCLACHKPKADTSYVFLLDKVAAH